MLNSPVSPGKFYLVTMYFFLRDVISIVLVPCHGGAQSERMGGSGDSEHRNISSLR